MVKYIRLVNFYFAKSETDSRSGEKLIHRFAFSILVYECGFETIWIWIADCSIMPTEKCVFLPDYR
jgi:hypothetical protein